MMKLYFKISLAARSIMLLAVMLMAGSAWSQPDYLPQHPRLLFTKAEEPAVKRLIRTDPLAGRLAQFLKAKADSLLDTPQIPYALDKYGALLHTSRAYVARLTTLSLAYRIYGDKKYAAKVNETLLWVCNYPDWHKAHYLDTAEMTTAVAIAYDWLYDVLPPETKEQVKRCIYDRAISVVLNEYEKGGAGSWAKRETNWNVVCNSGMTIGALAIAEDYPTEATTVLQNAAKYIPNCLKHFAPDGVCYEGPAYWGYTTSYLSMYLKAVMDNGGDKGNIAQLPGMSRTALYYKRTLTPSGQKFFFGNAHDEAVNLPSFFLFSKLYKQPEIAVWCRNELSKTIEQNAPLHQMFFLSLPWFDAALTGSSAAVPALEVYHNDINDLIVFNGDRNVKGSIFLIAKGGEPRQAHQQLDCGTFIVESDSVCWTEDLGSDDYSLPGFWDQRVNGERWKYFRNSNLSHNTISIDHKIQNALGEAFVCEEKTDAPQPYATLNMTSLYKDQAKSVYRKFTLLDDRIMEVRDNIELVNPQSTASWITATKAEVTTAGNKACLTRNGKRFYMEIVSPANATFKTYPAKNTFKGEYPIVGITMIEAECKFDDGKGEIVVRMSRDEEMNVHNPDHGLHFTSIPNRWDEGVPLGNGIMGTLIWQKQDKLRLALDRADLWDLRPVKEFDGPSYTYKFIQDAVAKNDLTPVYKLIDERTDKDIAPTKIPAGAIEFPIAGLGEVQSVDLDIHTAICTITWKNGAVGQFFTGAEDKIGHFRFTNLPQALSVDLCSPLFETPEGEKASGTALSRLGYKKGKTVRKGNTINYRQKGYGDVSYEISLRWNCPDERTMEGTYCLTTSGTPYSEQSSAEKLLKDYTKDFPTARAEHKEWWKNYWQQCEIHLPDKVLERQWYLEMYKFGAASRKDAPPICLQAVWTADNGQTPPWRGDFHNDLNTQLSYWPGYASNHLTESSVFTDWLWQIKANSEEYTRKFFEVDGLNVACIATLDGKNIGGWNQYSHQPTASGWLSHHFYLQWKYSADSLFLRERAYPWVKETARYFENISVKDGNGKRKLPLSSSPEVNDNRPDAWFTETTNFDLACILFTYKAAIEMAESLGLADDAKHWKQQLDEWPDFATDATGLTIAPDYPLRYTHRHLSNMLAIHPLGLLDVSQGKKVEQLIKRSIHHAQELGTGGWVGYTYSWLANLQARVFDGDAAARSLHIFAKAFCSPNSFHLNGDQLKKGYSGFTYRPFTLEGNFACASAIQEMLLQSHTGIIRVFPALPEYWQNASFRNMRAMGAFLVSASYKDGAVERISILSEKGGTMKLFNPFSRKVEERQMKAGETMELVKQ